MALTDNNVRIFMSGGLSNSNPDLCLGGEMSTTFFSTPRIFDSILADQTVSGYTDYRCVYINNSSEIDTLYSTDVFIDSEVSGGASVMMGIEPANERQDVYITNASAVASGGFVVMLYDYFTDSNNNILVSHNQNINQWAENFQSSIRSINGLDQVSVTGSYIGTTAYFTVNFIGSSERRYFDSMELVSLSQDFLNVNASLSIQKVLNGSPKLKTANEIASEVVVPANVIFVNTSSSSPIYVGNVLPAEYFAVWLKRTVVAGVDPLEGDGFTIKIRGKIL